MLKFYTDEHIHPAVIKGLRSRGVDVLSSQEADMLGVADAKHLAFALQKERVIITQDTDFLRLHSEGTSHAGIVYAPQTLPIGDIIRRCMLIYSALGAKDMRNHVEFL